MKRYEFWTNNRYTTHPACTAVSMSDLRATVRAWWPRSVRLTQVTNSHGEVSFLMNGEFYGNVVECESA